MVSSSSSRRGLPSLPSTALAVLASSAITASAASCSKYTVTGPTGNQTYNNYAFYDFRQLGDQLSGTPMYSQDEHFPNGQFALSTSTYFNSTPWTNNWSTTANLTVANHTLSQYTDDVFTPLNVAILKDNSTNPDGATVLSMTTVRLNDYSASAQIGTNQKFMHASVRLSARLLGPKGACAGFYIYGDDDNESDIEILTNDTSSVFHATNHPSQDAKGQPIPGATSIVPIPKNGTANGTQVGSWSDWNEWRMDWLQDRTQWIVNGDLVIDKTYHPPGIPSFLGINMWSNGGTWTGNMTVGDTATLQIRWIEIAYNTTNDPSSSGSACQVQDNNDGGNNLGNINSATKFSSGLLAWSIVIGASLWSLL